MSLKYRLTFYRRARFKLTAYYTAILLFCLVVLGGFLYYRTTRSLRKEVEKFVRDQADDLMAYAQDHPGDWSSIERLLHAASVGERYYEISFRILDPSGTVLAASRLFLEEPVLPLHPGVLRLALKGETSTETLRLPDRPSPHFLMTRPYEDETRRVAYIVQGLAYLEPVDKLGRRFLNHILSAIPVFAVISLFGGYVLARKVLKPVRLITRTTRQITSAKLDQRLTRSGSGDEFDMLAVTLNEMIQRLQESFALLRQFAADAAHELRTPLTIMKGEAEIALRSRTADPQAYRATLESNIRECDHMIGIITNLLFLAQADTGDVPLSFKRFRLDQLLAELAETFHVLAEEASLTLETAPFPETMVSGDRSRLHELFANLLDNAVKYTPAGGRISISCDVGPGVARVAVSDTGIGIPEAEHERIFDRFYRVDHSRARESGGCGIGLSIARWIVRAHGGSIEVHSAPGAGSTFIVTLPLTPPLPRDGAGADPSPEAAPNAAPAAHTA